MEISALGVAFVAVVALALLLVRRGRGSDEAQAQAAAQAQAEMAALRSEISALTGRTQELAGRLDSRLEGLDSRLLHSNTEANRLTTEMSGKLIEVQKAAERMLEEAKGLTRLEDLLRPPKARGSVGEMLLENLLAEVLPRGMYATQHGFSTGVRVDAVIHLQGRLVPVDAKFPLESFERMASLEDQAARDTAGSAFVRDVRKHIDDIASRYILPDEGTLDIALMYVPAEAVYYEVLRAGGSGASGGGSLYEYALQRKVFPVSPMSLYAYLQAIALGLRGMQVEQNARQVLAYLGRLRGDLDRFQSDFETVGKHLTNAHARYDDARTRLGQFSAKLASAEEAPALEAATSEDPAQGVLDPGV